MNRAIYIVVFSLLLSGCPAIFYGNLKNESADTLIIRPPGVPENPWIIQSEERVQVIWYQQCIVVSDSARTQYFRGWPIPPNVVKTGVFSSSLNAVFKDHSLFFESLEGILIPVPEVSECGNA